jgi:uncharacterized protein
MQTRTAVSTLASAATALVLAATLAACGPGKGGARTPAGSPPSGNPAPGRAPGVIATGTPAPGSAALTASTTDAGTITTQGTGMVSGAPDTMTLTIDVSTSAPHAATALLRNNALAAAVQRTLERDGVKASDIQTSGLSLQENYPPSPAGFQVDDSVNATLHDLTRAGTVIDEAVASAGDSGRLDGVAFSISDSSPLLAAARQQAVAAARVQAEQLAAAAGESLGALVSLSDEQQSDSPDPLPFAANTAASAAAPVPVRPGTQQLSVAVTAVWRAAP